MRSLNMKYFKKIRKREKRVALFEIPKPVSHFKRIHLPRKVFFNTKPAQAIE
jgi:hypothetical protein